MAQDYNEYLAINVLNELQLVTYRTLSRALKVHSNLAKQMLYDFHHKQNAKKPGKVHATYLLTGLRRVLPAPAAPNGTHSQEDGEDTIMQSSPPIPSSSAPKADEMMDSPAAIRCVMLVKEEHLEQARGQFDSVSSIHIYSLEAEGLSDVQALTECNRKIAAGYASEDALETWKQYGTIHNPNAKRRARQTALPPPPPAAPVEKNPQAKTNPFATTAKAKEAEMKADKPTTRPPSAAGGEKKNIAKPAQAKRQNSDIFKSFSKAKTKPKQERSQSSAEASPAPEAEDERMGGFSDDDDDDTAIDALEEQQPLETGVGAGKSKKEREAELQAMMDQEDEVMEDAAATPQEEQPTEGAAEPSKVKEEEPKETVTVENGRRRGRRRVMKKQRVKDEQGYLVTREEAVWESFSEEEPEPKKIKRLPTAESKPAGKKSAKQGQGNIMSFFAKK